MREYVTSAAHLQVRPQRLRHRQQQRQLQVRPHRVLDEAVEHHQVGRQRLAGEELEQRERLHLAGDVEEGALVQHHPDAPPRRLRRRSPAAPPGCCARPASTERNTTFTSNAPSSRRTSASVLCVTVVRTPAALQGSLVHRQQVARHQHPVSRIAQREQQRVRRLLALGSHEDGLLGQAQFEETLQVAGHQPSEGRISRLVRVGHHRRTGQLPGQRGHEAELLLGHRAQIQLIRELRRPHRPERGAQGQRLPRQRQLRLPHRPPRARWGGPPGASRAPWRPGAARRCGPP